MLALYPDILPTATSYQSLVGRHNPSIVRGRLGDPRAGDARTRNRHVLAGRVSAVRARGRDRPTDEGIASCQIKLVRFGVPRLRVRTRGLNTEV